MSQCALGRHMSEALQLLLWQTRSSVRDVQSSAPSAHTAQVVPLQPSAHSIVVSHRRSGLQRCTARSAQRSAPGEHSLHWPAVQPSGQAIAALHSPPSSQTRASFDPTHSRMPTVHAAQRPALQPSVHAACSCHVPSRVHCSTLSAWQRSSPVRHGLQRPSLQPCSQRSGVCQRPSLPQLLASAPLLTQARMPAAHSLQAPPLQPCSHALGSLQLPSPAHTRRAWFTHSARSG